MKPVFSCIMLFMMCFTNVFGQSTETVLTDAEWGKLFPHLEKEEWAEVEKLTFDYLNKFKAENEDSDEAAIVRYMYLSSVGGRLGDRDIDKEEAIKKVEGLKGKHIITPGRSFRKDGMFNFFRYNEESKRWSKCFSNLDRTTIYAFEYFSMTDSETLNADFMARVEGKIIRLKGKVNDITAQGSAMPRLQINYSEAEIWDMKD